MQTSARNQIVGIVADVIYGEVNASVVIKPDGGENIVSTISKSSVEKLAISLGDKVTAIIKASNVILSTTSDLSISARNKISGKIVHIKDGAVNCDVEIDIGSSNILASVITVDSKNRLGLDVGQRITAIIKSSDVIIGK